MKLVSSGFVSKSSPVLCVNCKYFVTPANVLIPKKQGRCRKMSETNLVDGSIEFKYAFIVRDFDCHGEWYEPITNDIEVQADEYEIMN